MDFFRQLLRLVYRLLFLCSAEDRNLLFPPGVPFQIQQVYREGYSLARLRDLAIRSGSQEHQHSDLWKVQVLMFRELEKETGSDLGLPALGGCSTRIGAPISTLPNSAMPRFWRRFAPSAGSTTNKARAAPASTMRR